MTSSGPFWHFPWGFSYHFVIRRPPLAGSSSFFRLRDCYSHRELFDSEVPSAILSTSSFLPSWHLPSLELKIYCLSLYSSFHRTPQIGGFSNTDLFFLALETRKSEIWVSAGQVSVSGELPSRQTPVFGVCVHMIMEEIILGFFSHRLWCSWLSDIYSSHFLLLLH